MAVDLADRGVGVDHQLAVTRPGARCPGAAQRDLGEPVELTHVPVGEAAQERPDRGGGQHPVPEHAAGCPGAQHLDVVDAVPTSDQAVHQREDLGTGMAGTGPVAEVDQFVRGPLQAEPLGQSRRQQQPGACDRVIVVERDIDMVKNDMRGSHRKGVLRLLVNDSLAAVILPGQRTLFIIRPGSPDHSIGGSRLNELALVGQYTLCDLL